MKKSLIVLPILVSLFFAGSVFANGDDVQEHDEDVLEIITTTDLGVEDPGVLPTSPLYFFKEVGRTFQRAFTFNRTAKAELELRITNEKAAEVKKVEEEHPNDANALKKALENYQRAQERLKLRIENLGENSDNPNVDELLEKLTDRIVLHEKLFEELAERHDAQKNIIQDIRTGIEETAGKAAEKDTPERFKERLRLRMEEGKGSDLKHFRSVDFLERIEKHTPEETRLRLEGLREDFVEKVRIRLEEAADEGEEGIQRLRDVINRIPGDALRHSVLLEEIRVRSTDRGIEVIERIRGGLEENIQDGADFTERVEHQIKAVEEKIERLENNIHQEDEDVSNAAVRLLQEAKNNLEKAKTALGNGNPREAFGLARSAEAIVGNILYILQGGIDAAVRVLERIPTLLDVACIEIFQPVCGEDGKTYSNRCVAEQQNRARVAYEGECKNNREEQKEDISSSPLPVEVITESPVATVSVAVFTVKADDNRLSPNEIRVKKGTKVQLTFVVDKENTYFGGLDFRSPKFNTGKVERGATRTVEFTADESFEFRSYWPASDRLKAIGKVIVE